VNYKGQTTNRWKMSALVISLSALVLVTLAAYAPADVAAADIAFSADSPMLVADHCSDAVTDTELDRTYGTFAGCWYTTADHMAATNLDRTYGTFAGVWTGYLDRVVTVDANLIEVDRNYGTFAGVWTGYLDR
jgi:hypothetical protein